MNLPSIRLIVALLFGFCSTTVLLTILYLHSQSIPVPSWLQMTKHSKSTSSTYANEILLIYKTGAAVVHTRLSSHFTYLRKFKIPHYIIYSDLSEVVDGNLVIDILSNVSSSIKSNEDFKTWHILHHLQSDAIPIAHADVKGGWVLDKYKYLPALAHACQTYPDTKWYILLDDDSFVFWHSMQRWLSALDYQKPYYFGSINKFVNSPGQSEGVEEGLQFAHGGSGIVLSQAAMAKSFGANPGIEHKYDKNTAMVCCGDALLGKVLHDCGIPINMQQDGSNLQFQGEPPWRIPISGGNWCEPLLTLHHVNHDEILALHEMEDLYERMARNKPVLYNHIYKHFVEPHLEPVKEDWDNLSEAQKLENISDCALECQNWTNCAQWRQIGKTCWLSDVIMLGQAATNSTIRSGWHLERIRQGLTMNMKCNNT